MNRKTTALSRIILTSFVMLLSIAAISSAATSITWDNGGLDGDWNTGTNWSTDAVPNTTSDYARITTATGPVFSGQTATAFRVYLEGANGTLTMNSGTLTTNSHIYAAAAATDSATINMNGGAINIVTTFYISQSAGSSANINLSGGTITCATLSMGSAGGTGGRINIEEGTLSINTTGATNLNTYIANGWIKAYNGIGTLVVDTTTTPGKTIVTALPQTKAGVPSPANNATNVSITTDLSWLPLPGTASHDVYFGTSLSDVNTANRLLGDLNGNGVVDLNDMSLLAGYWLQDPAGTNPYAGVNDDNIVDFFDYALFSQDWMKSANPVFKGNQDVNTFDPGTLAEGTIYYWRIDEVNSLDTIKGDLWKFTTEGYANIKKGPYLIYPKNNTQMTVLWQVDATTSSSNIAWGTDTTYSMGNTNTTEYGIDHQHKYNITGLTPGTKYYYRVTFSGKQYTGSFYAAPPEDATNVKFFMYGDTRTNAGSNNTCANRMISLYTADPATQTIVLHAGDWVNSDSEATWTSEWFTNNSTTTQLYELMRNVPIAGCAGNHEGGAAPVYSKYWPQPYVANHYYSFDYGPVHIAVIDMYNPYTSGNPQYTWLVSDLSASTKPWKIMVFHEPAWNAGGSHGNNATAQATFQPLAQTYGAQICLAGHNHFYSRCAVPLSGSHIIQHITHGAGGAPYYTYDAGQPYVEGGIGNTLVVGKVTIDGDLLTHTAYNASTGTVVDTVTIDRTTW